MYQFILSYIHEFFSKRIHYRACKYVPIFQDGMHMGTCTHVFCYILYIAVLSIYIIIYIYIITYIHKYLPFCGICCNSKLYLANVQYASKYSNMHFTNGL